MSYRIGTREWRRANAARLARSGFNPAEKVAAINAHYKNRRDWWTIKYGRDVTPSRRYGQKGYNIRFPQERSLFNGLRQNPELSLIVAALGGLAAHSMYRRHYGVGKSVRQLQKSGLVEDDRRKKIRNIGQWPKRRRYRKKYYRKQF